MENKLKPVFGQGFLFYLTLFCGIINENGGSYQKVGGIDSEFRGINPDFGGIKPQFGGIKPIIRGIKLKPGGISWKMFLKTKAFFIDETFHKG
jgi:hypothetical protein